MIPCRAALVAALAAMAWASGVRADGPESLWIDDLGVHDKLDVRTAAHHLRFDILDPSTGEALASLSDDGVHFGQADRVFLLGATRGRHAEGVMFVRMGRLEVGKRLELAVATMDARNRRITEPIQSVRVTRSPRED